MIEANEGATLARIFDAIKPQIARPVASAANLIHRDDAIQVAREAILKAIRTQDPSRLTEKGGLEAYATVCARNALFGISARAARRVRLENAWDDSATVSHDDWRVGPMQPDDVIQVNESAATARAFCVELVNMLGGRDREVAMLMMAPVMNDMEDFIEVSAISERLGITANQVNHAIHNVRLAATALAETNFIPAIGPSVVGVVPMVHMRCGPVYDNFFVSRVARRRNLTGEATGHRLTFASGLARLIVSYSWGCVLTIWTNSAVWTTVIEGTLRVNWGLVNGRSGFRKMLDIPNYRAMSDELMNGQEFDMSKVNVKCDVMPACIGDYEADALICDGDNGKKACVSKDICIALQQRMVKNDAPADKYVKYMKDAKGRPYAVPKNLEAFQERIEKAVKEAKLKPAKEKPAKAKAEKATKAKAEKPAKAKAEKADKPNREPSDLSRFDNIIEVYDHFIKTLSAKAELEFVDDGEEAKPGQVVVKDRLAASGYKAHYMVQERGAPVALFCALLLPRANEMRVTVALDPGEYDLKAAELKALGAVPRVDGKFKSTIPNIKDDERAAFVAECLATLIGTGTLRTVAS